jgi:hypothetical protein
MAELSERNRIVQTLNERDHRIAELERTMFEAAHLAAILATAETGDARNRIMTISNRLNAALGRTQSSHGEQFNAEGQIVE